MKLVSIQGGEEEETLRIKWIEINSASVPEKTIHIPQMNVYFSLHFAFLGFSHEWV